MDSERPACGEVGEEVGYINGSKRQNNTERFKAPRVEAGCLGEVEQEAD